MNIPYYDKCKGAYVFMIAIVFLIGFYSLFLITMYGYDHMGEHDLMNQKVFSISMLDNCCSWWPISHLILFFILGLLFPYCDVPIITAGIIWELIEMILSKIFNRRRQGMRVKGSETIEYSGNWWAGSFKDILFNIIGFYLGKIVILSIQKKDKLKT